MKRLPRHLEGKDFPSTESTKGGVTTTVHDLSKAVLRNLEGLKLDRLIAIGGDDTLSYAARLHDLGAKVIAIPKTMDNDVRNTEYCIGFSTAITRAKEAINRQRTTLGSHERIGVFRIFGRDAGFTSLYTAYVTSARCLIPEAPFDLDRLALILAEDHAANPSHYAFVIAAEGAVPIGMSLSEYGEADAYGHRRKADIGEFLAAELRGRTGIETVESELTYDLRSGEPDSLDQMAATTFANIAMDLVAEGVHGRMVGIVDGKYAHVPIPDPASAPPRRIDVDRMYNTQRFRPRYDGRAGDPLLLTSVAGSRVAAG
jgi:6-phosphofructokinase 1